jgi:hypothetical protein
MGIIQTDQWLKQNLEHPVKMCENLLPYFKNQSSTKKLSI